MAYFDDVNHSGCMWGLLRFLDLHKHHHKRKMISYRSHGHEKHERGTRIVTSTQDVISSEQEQLLDKGVNFQMEDKHCIKKRSSGKAHFLTLLYKKMTRKKDRKLKISLSASQLLRTLSIHHLECTDYVPSDSATSDSDSSTFEDSSARSEKAAVSPRGTGGTSDKKRLKNVIKENRKKEHQISMDGVLDKIPIDHKLSDKKGEKRSNFGSEGFAYTNSKFAQRSIKRSRSLTETSTAREPQTLPRRSNSFKEGDNNFLDGRYLRSCSLSDSLDRYSHLLESISAREPRRPKSLKVQDDSFAQRRTLRSLSLTESFNIYSRLLESVLAGESEQLPHRSNSVREKDSDLGRQKTLRSRSLTDSFDVYSRMLESISVRETKRQPERVMSILEEDCSLSIGRLELDSLCNNVRNEVPALSTSDTEVNTNSSDRPNVVSVLANTEEIIGTETFEHHNEESTSNGMPGVLNHPELISAHDPTKECIMLDDLTADNSSPECDDHKGENIGKADSSDKPTEPSLVSVLDSLFEEDPENAAKYAMRQGAVLQSSRVTYEEQDFGANPENPIPKFMDTTDTGNINTSHIKEEPEFNYVKGVLKESGFDRGAEEFLAAWYSSYEPIDQLLYVSDLETMRDDYSEIPIDCRLLLDLINEVLLDIYQSIITCSTGLSCFCPRIRTVPVGDHVLEEVWAKVKWHLDSQRHMNNSLEQLEARDFAKGDGWMNLFLDVEVAGIELEGWMLDVLIDEIILDFQDM